MKIVVLDGHTLNPGDLNWKDLDALGECVIHPRSAPAEVVPRCEGADIVITNKVALDARVIAALPSLRYIGVTATGYNIIDVQAAVARDIVVTNVPTYGTPAVAQMAFALLLELTHHAGHHSEAVHAGRWTSSPDFCFWDSPLIELQGLTMGIVGFGAIGQAVGRIAASFGMQLAVHSEPTPPVSPGYRIVPLEELFRISDVVSLHCPLTPATRGIVNAERLASMKKNAFLINTSRGPLVEEAALAAALNAGTIAGAGVDVLSSEPPAADNPLLIARNCIVTPHIAWATRAARIRLQRTVIDNIRAFLAGTPVNTVR